VSTSAGIGAPSGGENLEVMREARNYNRYLRCLIRRHAEDHDRVLDFGAGIGTFSDAIPVDSQRMHCVETDPASRRRLDARGYNTHADLADVADASISYAFTLNVLEHIEDDGAVARELYRVLRPGARLLVYVPAFPVLFTSMDRHVGHLRRYRLRGLRKLLHDAGFVVEKAAYADCLGFPATLAYRLADGDVPRPLNSSLVRLYDRFLFPVSRLLSIPLARIVGKNVYAVARRPAAATAGSRP